MTSIEFYKGHGTGNDFVIVPDLDGELRLSAADVAALCDRRFGVGGDGVLRVVRAVAEPETADVPDAPEFFMDYRNADGSLAEMCGNGVRVFVRYLVEAGLATAGGVRLLTRAGTVEARAGADEVAVRLSRPRVGEAGTALVERAAQTGEKLELAGLAVDCGNPHLVCALPGDVELAALDLTRPPTVDPARFPAGVNVEFVTPLAADHVRMRVYERGSGETLSCGTGALAVAAATLHKAGEWAGTVTVDVPGGRLRVGLTEHGATLAGPAVVVARGTVDLARLGRR